jgi:hypothetical protein
VPFHLLAGVLQRLYPLLNDRELKIKQEKSHPQKPTHITHLLTPPPHPRPPPMAPDILRDSALGQSIRFLTAHKFFPYPEEKSDFELPSSYKSSSASSSYDIGSTPAGASTANPDQSFVSLAAGEKVDDIEDKDVDLERVASKLGEIRQPESAHLDVEKHGNNTLKPTVSTVVEPAKLDDGTVLVDWYTSDDDQNPQNWSSGKKALVVALIMIYTTAVYMGGSIYAPAEGGVMKAMGTSVTVAELGLALYVVGYGEQFFPAQSTIHEALLTMIQASVHFSGLLSLKSLPSDATRSTLPLSQSLSFFRSLQRW